MPKKPPARRGPKPQRLKIKGGFKAAARKLMAVKKPPEGWPPMPKVYAERELVGAAEEE
jgi:hypothetical protein